MSMKRFVLLDRDGTINVERHYLADPDELELLPGAAKGLDHFRRLGFGLIVVTNQSAVSRGILDEQRLDEIHARLRAMLAGRGVELDGIYHCPHMPDDGCSCRKPAVGLVTRAATEHGFDPARSITIGDKPCDIELGAAVGATTILVTTGYGLGTDSPRPVEPDFRTDDLSTAARLVEDKGL